MVVLKRVTYKLVYDPSLPSTLGTFRPAKTEPNHHHHCYCKAVKANNAIVKYLEFEPLAVLPLVELVPVPVAEKKSPQSSPLVVGAVVGGFTGRLVGAGGGSRPPPGDKPGNGSIHFKLMCKICKCIGAPGWYCMLCEFTINYQLGVCF